MMTRLRELSLCWVVRLCLLALCAAPLCRGEIPAALESALQRYIALPDALLPVLEAAQNKESAEKAAEDLSALLPRVYDARREIQALPKLAPTVAEEVRRKYETQMRTRWGKVYEHIFRLQRSRCYESVSFFKHFNTLCVMLEK